MISYPSLETKPITTLLENVSGEYSSIFEYNAANIGNEWKSYDPARPDFLNTLKNFTPEYGYWIKINNDTNWTLNGHNSNYYILK